MGLFSLYFLHLILKRTLLYVLAPVLCYLLFSCPRVQTEGLGKILTHLFFCVLSSLVADSPCCFLPPAWGPCLTSQQLFSNCVYKCHGYTGELHCFSLVKVVVLEFCFFSYKNHMLETFFFPFER